MNYISTTEFRPNLPYAEDAVFTLRKISHGSRIKFNEQASLIFDEMQDLVREVTPFRQDIDDAATAAKSEPCTCPSDTKHEHNNDTGRCQTAGCHCREPRPSNPDSYHKSMELNIRWTKVRLDKLLPAYFKWGVRKIAGYDIDGVPATVDSILETGLEDIVMVVATEIERLSKLSPEELSGFKQPTTSGAVVDGKTNGTIALSASGTGSTSGVAATSSSPA